MKSTKLFWGAAIVVLSIITFSSIAFSSEFEIASVFFERNATDGDLEAIFAIQAGDEGLETLLVLGPNNRTMINLTTLGGTREYEFESPEPPDQQIIMNAYPEGTYLFVGITLNGEMLVSQDVLSHQLPDTPTLLSPSEGEIGVPLNTIISWSAVPCAVSYFVEVESDEFSFESKLPCSVTNIGVPDNFLSPDTEYELQICTVSSGGNMHCIETTFTTQ